MYSLQTDRLIIRPFENDDGAFLDYLHSDFDVVRYTSGSTRSHNENITYIKTMQELYKNNLGHLIVVRKSDNMPLGRAGFSKFYYVNDGEMDWFYWGSPDNVKKQGEIFEFTELGYSFAKRAWGNGYATEAAAALRDYAYNELGFDSVSSLVVKKNIASVAVVKKLGNPVITDCMVHDQPAYKLRNNKNG